MSKYLVGYGFDLGYSFDIVAGGQGYRNCIIDFQGKITETKIKEIENYLQSGVRRQLKLNSHSNIEITILGLTKLDEEAES